MLVELKALHFLYFTGPRIDLGSFSSINKMKNSLFYFFPLSFSFFATWNLNLSAVGSRNERDQLLCS